MGQFLLAPLTIQNAKMKKRKKKCHGPRLCVCQAPNAFICVRRCPPPNTKCVYMCVTKCVCMCHQMRSHVCHQMRLYVCHQMRSCVSPFVCVSPNVSVESATELVSFVYFCSLRSHFFQQSKIEFLSKEHSCLNTDSCLVVDSCPDTDSCLNAD